MKHFPFVYRLLVGLGLLPATKSEHTPGLTADCPPASGGYAKDVVFETITHKLKDIMLDMAKLTSSDYLIDLGSGDGRIVIGAAKRGTRALGIEFNTNLVTIARCAAIQEGVAESATFENADIFKSDFSKASVITMYLLPDLNLKLRPKILDLKPGTRILSCSFGMADWQPDRTAGSAYFWIVPAKVDGIWKLENGQIRFDQQFQRITGVLSLEKDLKLIGKLEGNQISFTAGDQEYIGTVSDNIISGTHDQGSSWKATR